METLHEKQTIIINTLLDRQCVKCGHAGKDAGSLTLSHKVRIGTKSLCLLCTESLYSLRNHILDENTENRKTYHVNNKFTGMKDLYVWRRYETKQEKQL